MFLLFLLSPLLCLLISFKKPSSKQFRQAFLLMGIFMGMVLQLDSGGDMERYAHSVIFYSRQSWMYILTEEKDLLFPLYAKLFSYLSTSARLFIISLYTLYTMLFIKVYECVLGHVKWENKIINYFLLLGFFLIYNYAFFFSIRFSFATLLLSLCTLKIVLENSNKYYLIMFICPLIHYSFAIVLVAILLHYFIGKKLELCISIFLVSFVLTTPAVSYYINSIAAQYLPEQTSSVVSLYASEDGLEYMNNRDAAGAAKLSIKGKIAFLILDYKNYIFTYGLLLLCLFRFHQIKRSHTLTRIFTILLLFYAMTNVASSASRGDRFFNVCSSLIIYFLFVLLLYNNKDSDILSFIRLNKVILYTLFAVAILFGIAYIYALRWDYDYFMLFFGNPVTAIIKDLL